MNLSGGCIWSERGANHPSIAISCVSAADAAKCLVRDRHAHTPHQLALATTARAAQQHRISRFGNGMNEIRRSLTLRRRHPKRAATAAASASVSTVAPPTLVSGTRQQLPCGRDISRPRHKLRARLVNARFEQPVRL
eukprot:2321055-Pleurochrysis_carterae.AAC.1